MSSILISFFYVVGSGCLVLQTADSRSVHRSKRQGPGFFSPITHPGSGGFSPYNVPVGYNPALFSNPDTSSFNFGVDVNDGTAYNLNGGLRFPIIDKARGTFVPFDLNGDLSSGLDNIAVDYGHALKGVNPHDLPFAEIYPCLFGLCNQFQQPVVIPGPLPPPTEEVTPPPETAPPPTEVPETFPPIEPEVLVFTEPPTVRPAPSGPDDNGNPAPADRFGVGGQLTRKATPPTTPDPRFVGILVGTGVDRQDAEGVELR